MATKQKRGTYTPVKRITVPPPLTRADKAALSKILKKARAHKAYYAMGGEKK